LAASFVLSRGMSTAIELTAFAPIANVALNSSQTISSTTFEMNALNDASASSSMIS